MSCGNLSSRLMNEVVNLLSFYSLLLLSFIALLRALLRAKALAKVAAQL